MLTGAPLRRDVGGRPQAPRVRRTDQTDRTPTPYDLYFSSGLYQRRYPRANARSLAFIVDHLGAGAVEILDFGCGDGRYALPLLQATEATVTGYDVCGEALKRLIGHGCRFAEAGRLRPLSGTLEAVLAHYERRPRPQLAMLMFGVLGHIRPAAERRRVLTALARLLAPGGRLVLSVPNRRRRFRHEQRQRPASFDGQPLEAGDITYRRCAGKTEIPLFYHLYTAASLRHDLEASGFVVDQLVAESALSEHAVTASPGARALDEGLRRLIPLDWVYGFLASARPT